MHFKLTLNLKVNKKFKGFESDFQPIQLDFKMDAHGGKVEEPSKKITDFCGLLVMTGVGKWLGL